MSRTIPGAELRDRLLRKMADRSASTADSWLQVLAAPGNRELLALIGRNCPRSIGELADLAGRAQPNVSRSLSALAHAGLITVTSEGRTSVPSLTTLGHAKAQELKLVDEPAEQSMPSTPELSEKQPLLSAAIASHDGLQSDTDAVHGKLIARLHTDSGDAIALEMSADLNAIALDFLDHWWRILYRRAAPHRIGTFAFRSGTAERRISLVTSSTGKYIELFWRLLGAEQVLPQPSAQQMSPEHFQTCLLDNVVRPVARELRARYRYDRPVHSQLARLEESLTYTSETQFCRTAGALGISPYNLFSEKASEIRLLIEKIPDEDARLDFASAVSAEELAAAYSWASSEVTTKGAGNRLPRLDEIRGNLRPGQEVHARPWQLGTSLARAVRREIGLNVDASTGGVQGLSNLFGAEAPFQTSPNAPGTLLGFQDRYHGNPTVVVGDRGPRGTAFVLARAIGDYLTFADNAACVSDLYTDRQAVGRAFAAEFIAPGESVVRMIEEEDLSISHIANHYCASAEVINWQYKNNYQRYGQR
jgi:DNA-binding MarR family transcriptional regulator